MTGSRERSLARRFLTTQVVIVVLLVTAGLVLSVLDARARVRERASDKAVAVALSVADSPTTRSALSSPNPSAELEPFAEQVRRDTRVDFVVVMSLDHIRYTHPDPSLIGKRFRGDVGGAPGGQTFTQQYAGSLGRSMRAVVPVRSGGKVVALVAVGITIERIDQQVWPTVWTVLGVGAAVLAVGLIATTLAARRLRRQTHGLSESDLARMYDYHRAVLHAVREGMLLVDVDDRVQLVNDEARELLALGDDAVGRHVDELGMPPALARAIVQGETGTDDVYLVGGRAVVVNSAPALSDGREVGAVVTLRDRTELQTVSGELDVVRSLTEALRAQNHESANRLHTVVSLIELGRPDQAAEVATEELQVAQLLTDQIVTAVQDPVLSALLLGKTAEASERGVVLQVEGDIADDRMPIEGRDLITVAGNLVDNALDAAAGDGADSRAGEVRVRIAWDTAGLMLTVDDNGPGIAAGDADKVLHRGWSTKAGPPGSRGIGLALVAQTAERHHGGVTIERSPLGGARLIVTLRSTGRSSR